MIDFAKDHKSRSRPGVVAGGADTPMWLAFVRWENDPKKWTVESLREAMAAAKAKKEAGNAKVDWGTPHGNEYHRPAGSYPKVRKGAGRPPQHPVQAGGLDQNPSIRARPESEAGDVNVLAQAIPAGNRAGAEAGPERTQGAVDSDRG